MCGEGLGAGQDAAAGACLSLHSQPAPTLKVSVQAVLTQVWQMKVTRGYMVCLCLAAEQEITFIFVHPGPVVSVTTMLYT